MSQARSSCRGVPDATRSVEQINGCFNFIHILPTSARCSCSLDLHFVHVQLEGNLIHFRHDGYTSSRGMNSALVFSGWYPLYPVHPCMITIFLLLGWGSPTFLLTSVSSRVHIEDNKTSWCSKTTWHRPLDSGYAEARTAMPF